MCVEDRPGPSRLPAPSDICPRYATRRRHIRLRNDIWTEMRQTPPRSVARARVGTHRGCHPTKRSCHQGHPNQAVTRGSRGRRRFALLNRVGTFFGVHRNAAQAPLPRPGRVHLPISLARAGCWSTACSKARSPRDRPRASSSSPCGSHRQRSSYGCFLAAVAGNGLGQRDG